MSNILTATLNAPKTFIYIKIPFLDSLQKTTETSEPGIRILQRSHSTNPPSYFISK